MAGSDDDLDRIDGKSFVGWLIMAGAGSIGAMPWSTWRSIADLVGGPPRLDPDEVLWHSFEPFVYCIAAACIAALIFVMLTRAGTRLTPVLVLGVGAVMGVLTAMLFAGGDPLVLIFGLGSGLLGGGAVAIIRHLVIRRG